MTTRNLITIGVVIQGVGDDPNFVGGLALYYGDMPEDTTYQWVNALTETPASIDDRSDPFTGNISASGFTFDFAFSDIPATKLFSLASREAYYLVGTIDATDTSITLSGAGTDLAGTVVWIDDEAIRLDTYTGDSSGNRIYAVTRGHFSTVQTPHLNGRFVYDRNYYVKARTVILVAYDHETGSLTQKWRGVVMESPKTSDDGTRFSISANSLLSILLRKKINEDAETLTITGSLMTNRNRQDLIGSVQPRGYKQTHRYTNDTPRFTHIQVGDTLMRTGYDSTGRVGIFNTVKREWGAPDFEGDDNLNVSEEGGEIFVIDGDNRDASSTYDLGDNWAHPFAVALALCISGGGESAWDVVGDRWSCGASPDYFDIPLIEQAIAANPDLKIQRMQLGWDNEAIEWFTYAQEVLLRPNGHAWGTTEAGKIFIYEMASIAIDELAGATDVEIIEPRLLDDGPVATYSKVFGVLRGLPWQKERRITFLSKDGRLQDSRLKSGLLDNHTEIDLTTFRADQVTGAVTARLASLVTRGYFGLPVIGVKVLDPSLTGSDYRHGGIVKLSGEALAQAWLVDKDGRRVRFEDAGVAAVGRIIGRKYNTGNGTYDLDLLLVGYRSGVAIKWRAPSARLVSASTTTLTVEENAFHADAADSSFFGVGDAIALWSPAGALLEEFKVITAITDTTIVTDTAFTSPVAGSIVRLANYDDYRDNRSNPVAGVSEVVYVYHAKEGGTVGLFPSDEAAIYG